ncbi:hypothetical protein ON010_g13410 [Phytophthora cinnamomi]|nr:hypothetical protein ON010_g13410 [Phytophthora cinnamomi]
MYPGRVSAPRPTVAVNANLARPQRNAQVFFPLRTTHAFEEGSMAPANTNVECATDGQVPEVPLPPSASMTDVHAAWLAAGARGDVAAMRQLRIGKPAGLDAASSAVLQLGQLPPAYHRRVGPSHGSVERIPRDRAVLAGVRPGPRLGRRQRPDTRNDGHLAPQSARHALRLPRRTGRAPQPRRGLAKLLLNAGANVNTQDENGKMPLHYCVQEGGLLVTELLLAHGADIDAEDSDGSTPLKRVVQRADLNVLQLFFNHHQLVATPQRRDFSASVLFLAVDMEVEDVVRFVVDNDYAPVTARNAAGETPLHRAIVRHSPSVMELLADLDPEGDSLTAVTAKMETPTHYAARYGSAREVETLLLCLTRVFGDLEELVELGAANPLNVGDGDGMTSLYVAGTADDNSSEQVQVHDGPDESRGAGRAVEVRDAKVRLLLNHGGCLFPPELLVRMLSASTSRIPHLVLPVPVQYCLVDTLRRVSWITGDNDHIRDLRWLRSRGATPAPQFAAAPRSFSWAVALVAQVYREQWVGARFVAATSR